MDTCRKRGVKFSHTIHRYIEVDGQSPPTQGGRSLQYLSKPITRTGAANVTDGLKRQRNLDGLNAIGSQAVHESWVLRHLATRRPQSHLFCRRNVVEDGKQVIPQECVSPIEFYACIL